MIFSKMADIFLMWKTPHVPIRISMHHLPCALLISQVRIDPVAQFMPLFLAEYIGLQHQSHPTFNTLHERSNLPWLFIMTALYHDSSRKSLFTERVRRSGPISGPENCQVDLLEWYPGTN